MLIPENPQAQKRHRYRKAGNKIITYDPSSSDKKKTSTVVRSLWLKKPLKGALTVAMTFYCKRPKSHFRTGRNAHLLKSGAPVIKLSKPDIDNHIKYYLDSCNGIIWHDDAQVIRVEAWKVYEDEQGPRTELEVFEV